MPPHVLHDEQLAEDAFQATFLVLARDARRLRKQRSVASWLHGVALRVARNAKRTCAKANRPDLRNVGRSSQNPQDEVSWRETLYVLDEELQRLPDKYRLPLVLCYLEGMARDEAAAQLGWTTGKLRGQLERAREQLRSRLIRRGVTLAAAGRRSFACRHRPGSQGAAAVGGGNGQRRRCVWPGAMRWPLAGFPFLSSPWPREGYLS